MEEPVLRDAFHRVEHSLRCSVYMLPLVEEGVRVSIVLVEQGVRVSIVLVEEGLLNEVFVCL